MTANAHHPPPGATEWPAVSYVMPVLNEADYIGAALDSILAQQYPGETEIVLALGPSTDATNDIVAARRRTDPRIRSVDVPVAVIPAGLNRAIAACKNPIVVRVDAHVELPPRYTERAVATLLREDAANVGGIMLAVGRPGFQAAVARAYNSRWGLGGGAYHSEDEPPGEAESAYLGVMRRDAVTAIGGFDETVGRGEDWEMNQRLIAAGHRVWLDPALRVVYRPRDKWTALARQFWATGVWRAELVRRLPRHNSMRYYAPPAVVATTASAAALTAVAASGHGGPVVRALAGASSAGVATYAGVLGVVAARGGGSPADRARMFVVLATMHVAWGAGFLRGLIGGAAGTVDTSRVRIGGEGRADIVA